MVVTQPLHQAAVGTVRRARDGDGVGQAPPCWRPRWPGPLRGKEPSSEMPELSPPGPAAALRLRLQEQREVNNP